MLGEQLSRAGRPRKGMVTERTERIRIPISLIQEIHEYVAIRGFKLPLYTSRVQAGFPSPAEDYVGEKIDLNTELVRQPLATFLVRACGDSMEGARIFDGDLLVVDRSIKPTSGKIVIAAIDAQLTVKRLLIKGGRAWLMPANDQYSPIAVDEENGVLIWGVVTSSVHEH